MKNKTARIIGTFDCDLQTTTGHSHAGHVGQSGHTVCGGQMGHLVDSIRAIDDTLTGSIRAGILTGTIRVIVVGPATLRAAISLLVITDSSLGLDILIYKLLFLVL